MASLGFRPPQFSEDVAWLPPWLLHHRQIESSLENQPQISSNQLLKDLFSPHRSVFSGEAKEQEGAYTNHTGHLFLSGGEEDSHPSTGIALSPKNVLHLCLCLSSDGDSQSSQNQLLCTFEALHGSRKVFSLQQADTLVGPEAKACQLKLDRDGVKFQPPTIPVAEDNIISQSHTKNKDSVKKHGDRMDHNANVIHSSSLHSFPSKVANVCPQPLRNYKHSGGQHDVKYNARHIKDDDLNDAIELSIMASEALAIHELLKTDSKSEVLPARAILDAALKVKQARLEVLEYAFDWPSDEIYEIDPFSDKAELTMMDAFEDAGLSFISPDGRQASVSNASQVEETPMLENQCEENGCKGEDLIAHPHNILDGVVSGLKNSDDACPDDILCQPADNSFLSAVAEAQVGANLSHACLSKISDKANYLVADRFESRWRGGWGAEKGVDASAKLKQNYGKSIPNVFVVETSFLSESVPDENSCVQKDETHPSIIVCQSGILSEGCHDGPDEGLLMSQEVRSFSMSLVDPLCSVVPCSISLENAACPLVQNQSDQEVDAENLLEPKSEDGRRNFHYISDVKVDSVHVDSQATIPTTTSKLYGSRVQRQLIPLRNYSTLTPKNDIILGERRAKGKQQLSSRHSGFLPSSYQDLGCTRPSDQRDPKPLSSLFERTVGKENKKNKDANLIKHLVSETSKKRRLNQPEKEVSEIHVLPSVQRRSHCILNPRECCCLQDTKLSVNNLASKKCPGETLAQGTKCKLHGSKCPQDMESELQESCGDSPVKKGICFYTVELELQQKKDLQKYRIADENFCSIKENKGKRYSNPWPESQAANGNTCPGGHYKDTMKLIFNGLEFLLTGFSRRKEREVVGLIQQYGGMVLLDIPSTSYSTAKRYSRSNFQHLPIIISSKKLQTTKFLYGCAVNAFILKLKWITDSIAAGYAAPPEKYMILSYQSDLRSTRIKKSVCHDDPKRIFDGVGILLHGKHTFCTKLAIIIKHGGGQVFKTLYRLFQSLDSEKIHVGVVVAEDEGRALRHLRHCASERKIPMMVRIIFLQTKSETSLSIGSTDLQGSISGGIVSSSFACL